MDEFQATLKPAARGHCNQLDEVLTSNKMRIAFPQEKLGEFLVKAHRLTLFATAASLSIVSSAAAQAPAQIAEIVVTAQKRSESILDVPISISAVTQQTIERMGVRDTEELSRSVPGMVVQVTKENSPKFFSLRGVGPDGSTAATVAVYVDDTPITVGNNSPDLKIFDVDRIEVLRGPQGTLFGASAMGGAIRYVTPNADSSTFSGRAKAEVSGTAHGGLNYQLQGAASGPIAENLAFRVSAFSLRDSGYIDIVDDQTGTVRDKNANVATSFGGRAAISAKLNEALSGTLSVIYQDTETDALSFMHTLRTFNNVNTPLARYQKTERADTRLRDRAVLPSLRLVADLGFAELTSVSSYQHQNLDLMNDGSYALASAFGQPVVTRDRISLPSQRDKVFAAFQQEVRLASSTEGPFEWIVGGYYRRSKADSTQHFHSNLLQVTSINPGQLLANGDIETLNTISKVEELAGFGEVTWKVTDKLKLTAGARTSEVKSQTVSVEVFGSLLGGTTSIIPPRGKESPITPRFSGTYEFAADNMIYATAAKGYREGGANGPLFLVNAACQPALNALGLAGGVPAYESDSLWNYEFGAKGQLAERRITYVAAVYQIDWKNIQQAINLSRACGGSPIANLGAARLQGLEGEFNFRPTSGLTLGLNFNYFRKAELTENRITGVTNTTPPTPVIGALAGTRLPNTPDLSFTLSGQYDWEAWNGWDAYVRAELNSVGKTYRFVRTTTAPNDPSLNRESYEIFSLRAGLQRGAYEFSVFANNLFDADPTIAQAVDFAPAGTAGGFAQTTIRPRTIGVSLSSRF